MDQGEESEYVATETAQVLDDLFLRLSAFDQIENGEESLEEYVRRVVEDGRFHPSADLEMVVDLPLKARVTGRRELRVDPLISIGMVLGAALERDIPADSELEEAWLEEKFSFPSEEEFE